MKQAQGQTGTDRSGRRGSQGQAGGCPFRASRVIFSTHVSTDSFDADVLQSDVPVLVDFWAEWCGPCKLIAPILDEVSHDYADRMAVAKVNVDEQQAIAARYGIRGIPTLMLFKNGTLVGTKVGAVSKGQLTAFLDSNL